jgi:general secretion pathway protein D
VLVLRCFVRVICVFAVCFLAACSAKLDGSSLLEDKLATKPSKASKQERLSAYIAANEAQGNDEFAGFAKYGSDSLTGAPQAPAQINGGTEVQDVRLNLVNVPVDAAAKSVLGDVLELNYSVDNRVQGNVTIQTSQPLSRSALLRLFEGVLRDIGAAIVGDGESYRIVPLADAARAVTPLEVAAGGPAKPGQRPQIIPLRYVSAEEIREVIEPLVPAGMILRTDASRNAIILTGTSSEVAAIRETISVFDVDWMKGMSFALVPVSSSQPGAIVNDLEQIYDTKRGPLRGLLRFVPNQRLKSVLVISARAKYLKEATNWIRKLDALAESNEQSLHVYKVQNRTASELAAVLRSVLQSGGGAQAPIGGEVAPKFEEQVTAAPGDPALQGQAVEGGPETPQSGPGSSAEVATEVQSGGGDSAVTANPVRVVADESNNSLLIFATNNDYQRILSVLQEVDSQPNQVLLEAVIAEVNLDDELKFGVRWLFGDQNDRGTFTDIAQGTVASSFPGFSYFLKANDIGFTLNALSSVTDVRVLSSPSLVVLDNKKALLQVGDQVPIVTQSSRGTASGDAPVINNVELKDTGVILTVTPRVNDSGRVILDVEQEVSSVVKTNTSGIDSPTIRQRKIKTSVVVTDGQALALGGLIQERETTGKSKVPVLGDVPFLGNAFRQKTNTISRTELIIFIRPRVIRDMDEARRITSEFRKELSVQAPRVRRGETDPGQELFRILN